MNETIQFQILEYLRTVYNVAPNQYVNLVPIFPELHYTTLREIANELRTPYGYIRIRPEFHMPTFHKVGRRETFRNPYYIEPAKQPPPPPSLWAYITYAGLQHLHDIELTNETATVPLIHMEENTTNNNTTNNITGNVGIVGNVQAENVNQNLNNNPESKKSKTHWLQIVYWLVGIVLAGLTIWGLMTVSQ